MIVLVFSRLRVRVVAARVGKQMETRRVASMGLVASTTMYRSPIFIVEWVLKILPRKTAKRRGHRSDFQGFRQTHWWRRWRALARLTHKVVDGAGCPPTLGRIIQDLQVMTKYRILTRAALGEEVILNRGLIFALSVQPSTSQQFA